MAKRKQSDEPAPTGEMCAWPGCMNPGRFRAPKGKANLREFQYFCDEHIREFNKKWNYFEGMSEQEIYEFQRDATTGHRPTWRIDQRRRDYGRRLEEAFHRMFGDNRDFAAETTPVGAREKDALAVLDLEHPSSKRDIKAQYRELVKKYHPDVSRSAKAEETFKRITQAYHHLLAHYVE
ncbi:MAG: J domain-containing protein [Alphaproteobacteria bacterium]